MFVSTLTTGRAGCEEPDPSHVDRCGWTRARSTQRTALLRGRRFVCQFGGWRADAATSILTSFTFGPNLIDSSVDKVDPGEAGMSAVHDREINIDQNSDPNFGWGANMTQSAPTGQSFTAVSNHVRFIGMFVTTTPTIPPVQFIMTLLEGAGFSGAVVATRYATASPGLYGFLYFDFSGTALTVGKVYTASIAQDPPVNASDSSMLCGTSNVYPGGTSFASGAAEPATDCYFRALHTIYTAQVQPPINPIANGISTFPQGEPVPIKFKLEADGAPTSDLPPAKLVLGLGNEDTLVLRTDFRRQHGEYIYDLRTSNLTATYYEVTIFIYDIEVGSAYFGIQ
jgi:hypothetical protein